MTAANLKKISGFTIVEVLIFIAISGLLLSTVMLGSINALRNAPAVHQQWVAMQLAKKCMDWYVGQRRFLGYTTLTCPSSPTPTACSAPTGFSITTNIACTTWQSDNNYKTITVTVSGLANASLAMQIGAY